MVGVRRNAESALTKRTFDADRLQPHKQRRVLWRQREVKGRGVNLCDLVYLEAEEAGEF